MHKTKAAKTMTVGHYLALTRKRKRAIIYITRPMLSKKEYNSVRTVKIVGKLDVNKKKKEDSLLNTAFRFFTTKGFGKTSITDIVNDAGVAKGTFYLYFKDKFDIRNKLISHKSTQLFKNAVEVMIAEGKPLGFEEKMIFIIDNIINQLNADQSLLMFISKNLSWGIFKTALTEPANEKDIDFKDVFYQMIKESPVEIREPEIMLFMIVELVSSTCYSAILYSDPCALDELKPHLYETVRSIMRQFAGERN